MEEDVFTPDPEKQHPQQNANEPPEFPNLDSAISGISPSPPKRPKIAGKDSVFESEDEQFAMPAPEVGQPPEIDPDPYASVEAEEQEQSDVAPQLVDESAGMELADVLPR